MFNIDVLSDPAKQTMLADLLMGAVLFLTGDYAKRVPGKIIAITPEKLDYVPNENANQAA